MKIQTKKLVIVILSVTMVLALGMFLAENILDRFEPIVTRNDYGEGKKIETYEATVEDGEEKETLQIEVNEREYTHEEIQELFQKVTAELDSVVLGENDSLDRVEKNLNLVTELADYPVDIRWELDSYQVLNIEGEIQEEHLQEEGTLVELRGTVSYREEQMVYVRNAFIYPPTRNGVEKVIYDIQQELLTLEAETRQAESFALPQEIAGKSIQWGQKKESHWQYILVLGVVLSGFVIYRERDKVKQKEKQRQEELLRDYPGMISKLTMLLSTGTTLKSAWEKIVQNYEEQKGQLGTHLVYEEMKVTLHEMNSGISEAEAYERFGKRCGMTTYMKFGTLLSQNLRKGSKGISDILRMEAIQSFENRKSTARRLGEEAGAKLLMPMMGMLAVVLVMIMVPAFLTMQL